MYKRFRHILILILFLSGAIQTLAGITLSDEEICVGTTRTYLVDGLVGSTYTWKIDGVIQSAKADSLVYTWKTSGNFTIEVEEHQASCNGEIQTYLVKVTDQPNAFAGALISICHDSKLSLLTSSASNYTKLLWTTSGDGTFDTKDALHPIYTSGPNDRTDGKVTLTLTASGIGDGICLPVSSDLKVTISPIPTLVTTTPPLVCAPATIDLSLASVTLGSDPDMTKFEYFTDSLATQPLLNYKAVDKKGTYYIRGTNSKGCQVIASVKVRFEKQIIPNFAPIYEICLGTTNPPVLQSADLNGIGGSWNPAVISTNKIGITKYKFTPSPSPSCIADTTFLVEITNSKRATFNFPTTYCRNEVGAPLPPYSTNGIPGTWSPGSISTGLLGTSWYKFTPGDVGCGVPDSVMVTINDGNILPLNFYTLKVCQFDPVPDFPKLLINTILGHWAPSSISTNMPSTRVYRFIPDDGQCYKEGSLIVTVDPQIKPILDPIAPMCWGNDTIYLPPMSANNIPGKWKPAYIYTGYSGDLSFKFTPDAGLCATPDSIVVKIYDPIAIIPTYVPIAVYGGTTQVTLTATGGSGNYSGLGMYDWGSGWHSYTVSDDLGCSKTDSTYINDPQDFDVTVQILTEMLCAGGLTKIQVNASKGTAPYVYTLKGENSSYTPQPDGITYYLPSSAMPYVFEVRDALGAFARSESFMISDPQLIELTVTPTAPTYAGASDGTATVDAKYGDPASYYYQWNDASKQYTKTATGLPAGTYTVEVWDNRGCAPVKTSVVISDPAARTLAASGVDPICPGYKGSILLTFANVPNGTYDILYDSGLFSAIKVVNNSAPPIAALAGTYNNLRLVYKGISTPNGVSVIVKDPPKQKIVVLNTAPTCIKATGSIVVTNPPINTGFVYSLNKGSYLTSGTFTGLNPGTQLIQVKNTLTGCISDTTITIIDQPALPAAPLADVTQPNCLVALGTITVTSPVPAVGITYTLRGINPVVVPITNSTGIFAGLALGNYEVVANNAAGCVSAPTSKTIDPAKGAPAVPIASVIVQPDCVISLGTIAVTVPLGAAYQYSVDGIKYQSSPLFPGLPSGSYPVTVKEMATGCISAPKTLPINPALSAPAAPLANVTHHPDCTNSLGTIEVTTPLGAAYKYSINGIKFQISPLFPGLLAGSYPVTVKEMSTGCISAPKTLTIDPAPGAPAAPLANITDQPDCILPGGTLEVTKPLGAAYTYSVDGINYQDSPIFANLLAGSYPVTVKEIANGCVSAPTLYTMNPAPAAPAAPNASVTVKPDCVITLGVIVVSTPLGVAYQYSVNGATFQSSPVFAGLLPGSYPVTVKEIATGCISAPKLLIIDPAPGAPDVPVASVIANPDCTVSVGTIEVTVPLGVDFQYSVDGINFQNSPIFTGLLTGNYPVTVKDMGTGCVSAPKTLTIDPVPAVPLAIVTDEPDCILASGTIEVSSPLGAAYQYSVNGTNFQISPVFTGLFAGSYDVKVKDMGTGCVSAPKTLILNPALGAPDAPLAKVTDQPDCILTTGTIEVTGPLGTAYTYSVDGIIYQTSTVFAGLPAGIYPVTVKETGTGCISAPKTLTIDPSPDKPVAPLASVTAQPDCTIPIGAIKVNSPVPAAGITYTLTGTNPLVAPVTNATGVFDNLTSGIYEVTTTITAGCVSDPKTLTINPALGTPDAPLASVTIPPDCTLLTGTITVTSPVPAVGITYTLKGTNPVVAKASNTTGVFSLLKPGIYEVVTTNADGCISAPETLTVTPPLAPTAPVNSGNLADCAGSLLLPLDANSAITPEAGITITWWDKATGGIKVVNPTLSTATTRIYYAEANKDLCVSATRTPVTLTIYPIPAAPVPKVTIPPTCNNLDGTVVITSPKGFKYKYAINNGTPQASTLFAGLKAGTYSITVIDTLTNCISTGSIVVPAIPPAPVLTAVAIDSKCFGAQGSINFTVIKPIDGLYTIKYEGGEFTNVTITAGKGSVPAFAGNYNNLTIKNETTGCDSYDALKLVNVKVGEATQMVITETVVELDLKKQRQGSISLALTGGAGGYKYLWSNGATTKDITNLNNGSYDVTVTDANNCTLSKTIRIPVPNYPPVAVNDTITSGCVIYGNVVLNDTDLEHDPLFVDANPVVRPLHGNLILNVDGTFIYAGDPLYTGVDSFVYALYDKTLYPGITGTVILNVISDMDHDGIADADDPDTDGDGILNIYEVLPGQDWRTTDTDGDGLPNYVDIDSDGDGIVDNIETQSTAGYRPPVIYDANSNGVNDAYDLSQSGYEIHPIDTDGDGIPDFLDLDSDNDKVPDYIEGHDANHDGKTDHVAKGIDSDGDGLDNGYDMVNNDCNVVGNVTGSNAAIQDTDGDGIPDWRDDNDDNDAYLTIFEDLNGDGDYSNDDIDFDGIPEYLDFGRDCDLFIPNAFSPNGDNVHDYYQIYCINHYPNAKIYIFDQLGNKIFEKAHYGNLDVWKNYESAWWNGKPDYGPASVRNERVAPGTYYYVLDLGDGEVMKNFVFVSY